MMCMNVHMDPRNSRRMANFNEHILEIELGRGRQRCWDYSEGARYLWIICSLRVWKIQTMTQLLGHEIFYMKLHERSHKKNDVCSPHSFLDEQHGKGMYSSILLLHTTSASSLNIYISNSKITRIQECISNRNTIHLGNIL